MGHSIFHHGLVEALGVHWNWELLLLLLREQLLQGNVRIIASGSQGNVPQFGWNISCEIAVRNLRNPTSQICNFLDEPSTDAQSTHHRLHRGCLWVLGCLTCDNVPSLVLIVACASAEYEISVAQGPHDLVAFVGNGDGVGTIGSSLNVVNLLSVR